MEIVAEGISVTGAHRTLLPTTSLTVGTGEILVVTGESDTTRTSLALVLSGRMRPHTGTVRVRGSRRTTALRRRVALVDAPAVTEPEGSVPLRDVVAESLTLGGLPASPRRVRGWLHQHDLSELAGERFEHLDATTRTRVLTDLACVARTTVVVLDSPDRHGGTPDGWHEVARGQAGLGRAVVVICAPHSATVVPRAAQVGEHNPAELSLEDTLELSTSDDIQEAR